MKKLYTIVAVAVFLFLYIQVGIPFLSRLVQSNGVLVAFPIFLLMYGVFAYLAGAVAGQGPKAFVLFLLGFIAGDIWVPPILVGMNGQIPALPEQQLASDVFFFQLFRSWNFGVVEAWWLTYLVVPVIALAIFVFELRTGKVSKIIPRVML
ncbi:MAG: hypothetical protein APZ16_04525 [Candidatus Hadarchaeum yellowstonense]|uniref:Uncharacterized protein n=1 Tax=Hadarchaeum yellowstonense TaxID=1776334 RepID=A0A147JVW2_HADYE|nr:MAG: hypothetical protein APZ16_04525 [Candidatus Hadarchaeum yellowstonense]